jgi:lipopolysaccharide heptosyltransferase III
MMPADRILIYRLGSLGDTVVALPCFQLIRRSFPRAEITILTNRPVEAKAAPLTSVLQHSGLFDHVLDYPIQLREFREILRLRTRIRRGSFDLVVHLTAARGLLSSVRDYLFFRSCGIRKIIGVPFRREDLHVMQTGDGLHEWESSRLARRIRELGVINLEQADSWNLHLTPDEQNGADTLLRSASIAGPFVVVSLGTKLRVKDWTSDNWKELLKRVAESHPQLPIVALGAQEEGALVDSVFANWAGASANFCGKTSPRVSAAILRRARLFIGHDSGPMHLAAAVGTPCVAIFSGQAPRGQWFPRGGENAILLPEKLCADCHATDCRQVNGICILSIGVDQVLGAVLRKLEVASAAA